MSDPVTRDQLTSLRANRLDVAVFFFIFLCGVGTYIACQQAGASQLTISSALVVLMFVYSLSVALVPRLRVRLDQAGDNAYYLGLLFTLTSMGFALYQFGEAASASDASGRSGVDHIISNFGIALATTIAGIFLRVVLHQMRVDPADVESMTRIELAESSKRVRAALESISREISQLYKELNQRVGDLLTSVSQDFGKSAQSLSEASISTTKEILEASQRSQSTILNQTEGLVRQMVAVADDAREAIERLRSVELPPTKLSSRLEKAATALERIDQRLESVAARFESASIASETISQHLSKVGHELARMTLEERDARDRASAKIQESADQLVSQMTTVSVAIERHAALAENLEGRAQGSVDEVHRVHGAANQVLSNLTDATAELTKLVRRGLGSSE